MYMRSNPMVKLSRYTSPLCLGTLPHYFAKTFGEDFKSRQFLDAYTQSYLRYFSSQVNS